MNSTSFLVQHLRQPGDEMISHYAWSLVTLRRCLSELLRVDEHNFIGRRTVRPFNRPVPLIKNGVY